MGLSAGLDDVQKRKFLTLPGLELHGFLYRLGTEHIENLFRCIVDEACLPLGCLAIDVLLLSNMVCCGDMFTGPLPSNGSMSQYGTV
jgi:hypothetical protein